MGVTRGVRFRFGPGLGTEQRPDQALGVEIGWDSAAERRQEIDRSRGSDCQGPGIIQQIMYLCLGYLT